jgi:hypothetical protein
MCRAGYEGSGRICTDINECSRGLDDCSRFAICVNVPGTYTCSCMQGYQGDGRVCNGMLHSLHLCISL